MTNFIEDSLNTVLANQPRIDRLVFVLPSKRAGAYLKKCLLSKNQKTNFAPEIYSIEDFVEQISTASYASPTTLLCEFYKSYQEVIPEPRDSFLHFSNWGQTLLQDFLEIDRYLVDPSKIFSHLGAIQEINHWSLSANKTPMMENYLLFWSQLNKIYTHFNKSLKERGIGHQGQIYRWAHEKTSEYIQSKKDFSFSFIGFNALNNAEKNIIQQFLTLENTNIFWDNDPYFLDDPIHDAGLFMREHFLSWPYYNNKEPKGIKSDYGKQKEVHIIGIPKQISQAKYVGQLLEKLQNEDPTSLQNAAVVLGDELLLTPLLQVIPKEISPVNITMGYPLHNTPLAGFFEQILELQLNKGTATYWNYKDVLAIIGHSYTQRLCNEEQILQVQHFAKHIKQTNATEINKKLLKNIINEVPKIAFIFSTNKNTLEFCQNALVLLDTFRQYNEENQGIEAEQINRFVKLFTDLSKVLNQYSFVSSLKSFKQFFLDLLQSETLDFIGQPFTGLQIMGMLESRNLDFETVILTSVNEGILPAGKSNNSFLPFDLKVAFNLPTYKEKDAVYTYHFYRLLQRAKRVYLIYNTEPDSLKGGEPSRLIKQILVENLPNHTISTSIAAPEIGIIKNNPLWELQKTTSLTEKIKEVAGAGFSPSSLTNYIRNPKDFYKRSILKIKEVLEVEETIAANNFGTIVHDSLEILYTPLISTYLEESSLQSLFPQIRETVEKQFAFTYKNPNKPLGRNFIAINIMCDYVKSFIDQDITATKNHKIKLIGLEQDLRVSLKVPDLDFPVSLKGKIDRIDEKDGITRIIDYKTGRVTPSDLHIVEWEIINLDFKYSKAFQLLCYAFMYKQTYNTKGVIEACIFSFKNQAAGMMPFAIKEAPRSKAIQTIIDNQIIEDFKQQLFSLITTICDPEIAFIEKEV